MLRHMLLKNKKGQNTVEYVTLFTLVAAVYIGMQLYGQRSMNARIKDANEAMRTRVASTTIDTGIDGENQAAETLANLAILGQTTEYEPYYQQSDYDTDRRDERRRRLAEDVTGYGEKSERHRTAGFQASTYQGIDDSTDVIVNEDARPAGQ